MISNDILFSIKKPVSIAGENIDGLCYLRLFDDIQQANSIPKFCINDRYHIKLYLIPYDINNPQMIPEKLLEKQGNLTNTRFTQKFQTESNQSQKYELQNGTMLQITRKYGVNEDYLHIQDLYRGIIKSGDYKLPFQVPTKFGMNSSFQYRNQDGLQQAKIQYKIYLRIIDLQSNQIIVQKSIPIYINSRYKLTEQKRENEGNIFNFCLHRGMIELGIRTAKNLYKPGEVLELEYTLNTTRSQRSITKVEVKLNHFLSFTDDDENERVIENKTLYSNVLPGLSAGKRSEGLKSSITLPNDLAATVKMQFIKNHYILQVQAFADGLLTSLAVPVICQIPVIILESRKRSNLILKTGNSILNRRIIRFTNSHVSSSNYLFDIMYNKQLYQF